MNIYNSTSGYSSRPQSQSKAVTPADDMAVDDIDNLVDEELSRNDHNSEYSGDDHNDDKGFEIKSRGSVDNTSMAKEGSGKGTEGGGLMSVKITTTSNREKQGRSKEGGYLGSNRGSIDEQASQDSLTSSQGS